MQVASYGGDWAQRLKLMNAVTTCGSLAVKGIGAADCIRAVCVDRRASSNWLFLASILRSR